VARRTSIIGALVRAHAQSVRQANARQREADARVRRAEQGRAAAARTRAAELRAVEASIKAATAQEIRDAKSRERAEKEAERERQRSVREAEQEAHMDAAASAEAMTLEVTETVEALQGLLAATLEVDDRIAFDSLRVHEPPPVLILPTLALPEYAPSTALIDPQMPVSVEVLIKSKVKPMTFFEKLFGRKGRYERDVEAVRTAHVQSMQKYREALAKVSSQRLAHRAAYDEDVARRKEKHVWASAAARTAHIQAMESFEAKRAQRDAEVSELERAYTAGEHDSVLLYNEMVLSNSDYPAGFPDEVRLAYAAGSRQLVIDFELPTPDIVPKVAEYRYVKSRKATEEKDRKPAEVKSIYRELVAQTALRTLHEVFEADQGNHLDVAVFSGYVNKIDETTGNDVRPYLVSVRVTKDVFMGINLARVEPQACLRNLGAQVSAQPDEARAVRPVVEFDMVDPRFIAETNVLSELDARPNLMDLTPAEFEALVSNLFTEMGLETKLTRSSRDGGVDAVAFDKRPVLGGKVVIQAKRYRHTVGVSAVRDLYGTALNEGAKKGIIVATSSYGPDAYKFADDKPLELIDGGGLLYLLESIGRPARIIMPVESD
jgi:restriction system protein